MPRILSAQVLSSYDHPSFGEYFNLVYKASTRQAYNILNVVPQLMTNQPATVGEIYGGPHDYGCTDLSGGIWLGGGIFPTSSGAFTHVTVDSAGNALPFVNGMIFTGTNTAPYWTVAIWTTDSTTGRQVGIAGQLSGGMHGNGTNTNLNQQSFVWATFPNNTHITKVVGLYGFWALSSIGQVWSWGFANNKAQLQRGTSPAVTYLLPDTIRLPAGRHAVDICDAGGFGVILLDDGEVWGGGDQPKYWGGSSATSSNIPQNFTTLLTTSLGNNPGTGAPFTCAKVRCNAGAIYYIGTDSSLGASGDNICGEVGNGQMFPMNNYMCCPGPNGSGPAPYAYDNGYNEDLVPAPVRICPGAHNWIDGEMGPSNCWNANFVNNKGETWVWGRYKSGQTMANRASCNNVSGGLNGTYPDMINCPYPLKISPFTITSGTLITPTCFWCIANPGATNCSQGTGCYNGSLAAPIISAGNQNLPSGTRSVTITPSITYASGSKELYNIVTLVSSTAGAVMPFNTGSSINLTTASDGIVIVKDSAEDIMWKTAVSFDTIVIGGNAIGPIPIGPANKVIASIDTTWRHSIIASSSAYYTIDTLLLPPNSLGVFNLTYTSYDTVAHWTGFGVQTVYLSRIGTIYGAPYVNYDDRYETSGQSTAMSDYAITPMNGLVVVRVSGYESGYPILWSVMKEAKISPL